MTDHTTPDCTESGLDDLAPLTEEHVARIAKGLAHPARIRIIEMFEECRPRIAQEIVNECTLAQSTVSEHLRILRDAEILFARRDGSRTWYCMRRSVLRRFGEAVLALSDDAALAPSG